MGTTCTLVDQAQYQAYTQLDIIYVQLTCTLYNSSSTQYAKAYYNPFMLDVSINVKARVTYIV